MSLTALMSIREPRSLRFTEYHHCPFVYTSFLDDGMLVRSGSRLHQRAEDLWKPRSIDRCRCQSFHVRSKLLYIFDKLPPVCVMFDIVNGYEDELTRADIDLKIQYRQQLGLGHGTAC